MLEVIDLEVDRQFGEIGRAARHADIVDIAVMLGDHLGDLGQRAGLVQRLNGDPRRKAPRIAIVQVTSFDPKSAGTFTAKTPQWRPG